MTKAIRTIHNSNPAIQRVGAKLRKAIERYTPLRKRASAIHRRIYPAIKAIDAQITPEYYQLGPKHPKAREAFKRRREDEASLCKRSGYEAALTAARKPERDVVRLSNRALRLQPRSIADLAVHAMATRTSALMDWGAYDDDVLLHRLAGNIARVAGVRFPKLPND